MDQIDENNLEKLDTVANESVYAFKRKHSNIFDDITLSNNKSELNLFTISEVNL